MVRVYEVGNESNYVECPGLVMDSPEIIDGFWSDPKYKTSIKEAYYGEEVKFTIKTKNIPDGTVLKLKLKDYDSVNSDDLLNGYTLVVNDNLAEIEFEAIEKWNEFAKYEIDQIVEVFFEVEAIVDDDQVMAKFPENKDDYLKLYEKEVKITVIVELPHSLETGWGAKGLSGHTAMAIGNRFFDYGPDYSSNIKSIDEKQYDYDFNKDGDKIDIVDLTGKVNFDFAPGRPWWGEVLANMLNCNAKDVPLNKVIEFVLLPHERNNVYGEVNQVEFYVKPEQAKKMIDWWKDRYDHLKAYSVYPWTGEQCTTTVKSALQAGGILIPEITQKPIGMLNDMKYIVRSTTRKHFGEQATVITIKPESSTWKPVGS